jgi:twinkle protein
MDWTDIETRLRERVLDVCQHLLLNGKREGNEWVCGSVSGEPGRSFKVSLAKPGLWTDFNGGHGGKNLMGLWCAVRNIPFKNAIVEAKGFLGIRDDFDKRVKNYAQASGADTRPEVGTWEEVARTWAQCQPLTEGGPVWNYLVGQRKIAPEVLKWFDVREVISKGQWVMVFPYFAAVADDEQANILGTTATPEWLKFEALERVGGKKREWTSKGPEKVLWGMQLAARSEFKDARAVVICEGEKDALTWASYECHKWGVVPVSVPFGAKWKGMDKTRPSPNREWIDRCWDWLQGFETIYIALDGDEAGRRAAVDIIAEIGPRRCRLVEMPEKANAEGAKEQGRYKDINECLMAGVSAEIILACLDGARDFAPEKVKSAEWFREQFMAEWFDKELEPGLELPFGFPWKIRPGELTVWTGIEKSGKTTLLAFILVHLMNLGEKVMVASMEVKPVKTLKKISRQAWGGLLKDEKLLEKCGTEEELSSYIESCRGQAEQCFAWFAPNLWLYDHVGIARWRDLADDIRWARRRHGITQFVIDNFMRLGIAKDDYAQQADAITFFAGLAMELDVHIHVVVHQNKSEGRKEQAGKRSVAGAFEIIANAHNIVEVQRDDGKAQKLDELWQSKNNGLIEVAEFSAKLADLEKVPDGKFVLRAQRDGETQDASKYLWFLWQAQQYVDVPPGHSDHTARRYAVVVKPKPHYPEKDGLELPTNEELGIGGE